MDYLILINKDHSLAKDYIPANLEKVENRKGDNPDMLLLLEHNTRKYFLKMIKKAKKAGFVIICDSAYRSYEYQEKLYLKKLCNKEDTTYLAKPGESEHQTGLCVDIAAYQNGKYIDNPKLLNKEYQWLYNNSYKYGFILRYPKGKENITKYPYEPWHYRFVGKYAKIIMKKKMTLEEFLINYDKKGRNIKNS